MIARMTLFTFLAFSVSNSQITVRGGELFSRNQQLYGRYEVRMKTAQGNGILSTFFTFENDGWMPSTGNPWREIDIEILGRYIDRFQTNIITGTADSRTTSEYYPIVNTNPASDYHTYGIEWTPEYISFLFDGSEVRKTEYGDSKKQIEDSRDIPQSYRFNLWANAISGWVGIFDTSILPKYQFVNWIKYYAYSIHDKSFNLEWNDSFDSFDSIRWAKATHIIENFTQFNPANILIKDGTLILALTDLSGNGLTDIAIPKDEETSTVIAQSPKNCHDLFTIESCYGQIRCVVRPSVAQNVAFEITDLCGKTITQEAIFLNAGENHHIINTTSQHYAKGVYLIRMTVDNLTKTRTMYVTE